MAHSPYTSRAVAYVAQHPGCSKWDLASHLTYSAARSPSRQYYLVNTQIRLGHIVAIRRGNRYALYLPLPAEAAGPARDWQEEHGSPAPWLDHIDSGRTPQ